MSSKVGHYRVRAEECCLNAVKVEDNTRRIHWLEAVGPKRSVLIKWRSWPSSNKDCAVDSTRLVRPQMKFFGFVLAGTPTLSSMLRSILRRPRSILAVVDGRRSGRQHGEIAG
jgi:hypothetical protein